MLILNNFHFTFQTIIMYNRSFRNSQMTILTCSSTIVGVPKVRRDKYSVFNFLNNPTATELDRRSENRTSEPTKVIEAPPPKPTGSKGYRNLQTSKVSFRNSARQDVCLLVF